MPEASPSANPLLLIHPDRQEFYMNKYSASARGIVENQEQQLKTIEFDLRASTFAAHDAENNFKKTEAQLHSIRSLQAQRIVLKAELDALTSDHRALHIAVGNQKLLVGQTIEDTAAFVQNTQFASHAVARLASDAGSIYSVMHAADNDSQLYHLAKELVTYTNETAYLAEKIVQQSIVVSIHSSEIIASALANESEAISLLLENMVNHIPVDVSLDHETEQALLLAGNDKHTAKVMHEHHASQYKAAEKVYAFTNLQLNLNLHITVQQEPNNSFTVSFNDYTHPFQETIATNIPLVSGYCILLVKENRKDEFSLEQAEQLLPNKNQCIDIPIQDVTDKKISKVIQTTEILDTDQEPVQPNEKYVVFVLTVFTDEFKKSRNAFDNSLSAPSAPFVLHSKESITPSTKAQVIDFLSTLTRQVEEAEQEVTFKQLVANTQLANSIKTQDILDLATRVRDNELNNKKQIDLLASYALQLKENSTEALNKVSEASSLSRKVAEEMENLLNKLFFSADMIHKLHNLIVRQKAVNPLISDELLSIMTAAAADSHKAVDLTRTALQSAFTAFSSCMKSDAALHLAYTLSTLFSKKLQEDKEASESMLARTSHAVELAESIYKKASLDHTGQSEQMNLANLDLNKATITLNSLKAGLSAAKAAAGGLV